MCCCWSGPVQLYFGLQVNSGSNSSSGGGSGNRPGVYQDAAVASDSELCSKAGAGILRDNESAVDAAIATIFCLGVVNCHSTGLGGGGFMVVHQHDNPLRPIVFDFREVARLRASKHMCNNNSGLAINGEQLYMNHAIRPLQIYSLFPILDCGIFACEQVVHFHYKTGSYSSHYLPDTTIKSCIIACFSLYLKYNTKVNLIMRPI